MWFVALFVSLPSCLCLLLMVYVICGTFCVIAILFMSAVDGVCGLWNFFVSLPSYE